MFSTVNNVAIIIFTGWWRRFLERQDDQYVLRKCDSTAFVRMHAINEETLTSYYQLLEDTLKINGLQNCPSQICNGTGVPLNLKPPKIVVPEGMKKPCYQSPSQKGQITVVACCNAAGNVLSPLVIYNA